MPRDDRDKAEFATRRAATDRELAERHAGFDLSAKDNHMKYERAHFSVTTSYNENYRRNYDLIDWKA